MVADVRVVVPWFCSTTSTGIGPAVGIGAAIPTISLIPASTAHGLYSLAPISGVTSLLVPSISSDTIDNGDATLFKSVWLIDKSILLLYSGFTDSELESFPLAATSEDKVS